MKWDRPKIGDIRIVEKFLWLPLCFDGSCKWWERVKIKQRREKVDVMIFYADAPDEYIGMWINMGWAENDKSTPL